MERETTRTPAGIVGAPAALAQAAAAAAAGIAGAGLGAVFGIAARLRRDKPLHPVGIVAPARLVVTPAAHLSGSSLLDEAAAHACVVRASYSVGTGPDRADIEGLAVRVLGPEPHDVVTDLLFASTGVGGLARHVLLPRRAGEHAAMTTLLPVRSERGPLYLRVDPVDVRSRPWPSEYRLSWAHGLGQWRQVGTLAVRWPEPWDAPARFDPIVFPLPGTAQYPVITALREPAYRFSRFAWPRAGQLPAGRAPVRLARGWE